MNKLTLKLRFDNTSKKSFYDFQIDGKSLFDKIKITGTSKIGSLGWGKNNEYQKSLVRQFIGEEKNNELESGRIMLFVCSDCGHIGCGGITFKLIENENEIIWTDFGYENDYDENVDFSEHKNIGSFSFEKSEYKKLFIEYLNTIK